MEVAGLEHFGDDIAAADELFFDIKLGDGGPVGEGFNTFADFHIFEDVEGFEVDPGVVENRDDLA